MSGLLSVPAPRPRDVTVLRRMLAGRQESAFALALLVLLLVVSVALKPTLLSPPSWGTEIGLAAPLIAAAIATTPAFLGGRGGIDVSVGPAMGFVNAVLVKVLILDCGVQTPCVLVPAAVVRVQPIVATLGIYLLLSGVTLTILPAPAGTVPPWLKQLNGTFSIVPLATMAAAWIALKRTPYHGALLAVGSDDRACFTAGVNVALVRFLSYVLTGVFAGVAGLVLTSLIGSAGPMVGPTYTEIAISAAALGGVSLAGGRGGLLAAGVGAIDIFLVQDTLTYFNVSCFILQIAYGAILVASVTLNALPGRRR